MDKSRPLAEEQIELASCCVEAAIAIALAGFGRIARVDYATLHKVLAELAAIQPPTSHNITDAITIAGAAAQFLAAVRTTDLGRSFELDLRAAQREAQH